MTLLHAVLLAIAAATTAAVSPDPYAYLHGGSFSGPPVPESMDPLIQYQWDASVNATNLQVFYVRPSFVTANPPTSFAGVETIMSNNTRLQVLGAGVIFMRLDAEIAGWLEFDSADFDGHGVLLGISEYDEIGIVNAGPAHPIKNAAPVQHGMTWRLELNSQLYEGVRFGFLQVQQPSRPFNITAMRFVAQIKPTNYKGSFHSSDEMLTRVWYAGAFAVKLNLESTYFGAILMDRGDRISWTGDAHTSQAASLVAFANYDFVKHNIANSADYANGIESYSLYWILSVFDYYMYTADNATLLYYVDNITKKLEHGIAIIGTNPSLGFFGHDERLGSTFEDPSCPENQRAYEMLHLRVCFKFSELMTNFGRPDLASKFSTYALNFVQKLRKDPQWYRQFGMHSAGEAVNAGFTTNEEKAAIFEQEFADPIQTISFSPFNQYWIVQALAHMNRPASLLYAVDECWVSQLKYGATCFFETFSPMWHDFLSPLNAIPNGQSGYTSMCHPWGSGITKFLTDTVLGLKPLKPGFKEFEVRPQFGVQSWVKGSALTPFGQVRTSVHIIHGHATMSVPEGTVGSLKFPLCGRRLAVVKMNENEIHDATVGVIDGVEYAMIDRIGAGEHEFFFGLEGSDKQCLVEKLSANRQTPARFIGTDNSTQGSWMQHFGKDGYIWFSAATDGRDVVQLPSYVANISTKPSGPGQPRRQHLASASTDARAFETSGSSGREIGALFTQNPSACFQTFPVDVVLKTEGRPYRFAVYVVDWTANSTRQIVSLFDFETRNTVAPIQYIPNSNGGVYLIFEYDRSVRIRISQVRGNDASLSAIFFDPHEQL